MYSHINVKLGWAHDFGLTHKRRSYPVNDLGTGRAVIFYTQANRVNFLASRHKFWPFLYIMTVKRACLISIGNQPSISVPYSLYHVALWTTARVYVTICYLDNLQASQLGTARKVQCLKKSETNESGGRGGLDPSSYFNQCLIDIDFVYSKPHFRFQSIYKACKIINSSTHIHVVVGYYNKRLNSMSPGVPF